MTTETTTERAERSEPTVGKVLPDLEWTVTLALIEDYFSGLALDRTAFDRGEVPVPTMIATAADNPGYHRFIKWVDNPPGGGKKN